MKNLLAFVKKATCGLALLNLTSPLLLAETYIASAPEGQTMPSSVWRARYVHGLVKGKNSFDESGKKINSGADLSMRASVVVLEHGVSDSLTLQIKVPRINNNTANTDNFKNSASFRAKFDEQINNQAKSGLFGGDQSQARTFLLSDDVQAVAVRKQITAGILAAAKRLEKGPTGLGDMEVGALYNWYGSDTYLFSTGLGLRLPTGKSNVPQKLRPLGSGMLEAALRLNFDYKPVNGLWLSLQHQFEHALEKAKWQQPDEIKPDTFKPGTETLLEKRGFTHNSLVKLDYGLGAVHESLKAIALNAKYNFESKAPTYLDRDFGNNDEYTSKRTTQHSVGGGVSISGLAYDLPVGIDVDYSRPIAGKNIPLATDTLTITAKAYWRI